MTSATTYRYLLEVALAGLSSSTRQGLVDRLSAVLGEALPLRRLEVEFEQGVVLRRVLGRGRGRAVRRSVGPARLDLDPPGDVDLDDLGPLLAAAVGAVDRILRVASRSRTAHRRAGDLAQELGRQRHPAPVATRNRSYRRALATLERVAATDATVLLLGETGTGKEILARWLHRRSRRVRRPMVVIDCGALPPTLLESELYGHEPGAFTGADRRHRGAFERADGGTVLLDEVGELSADGQVRLLRVLQEGTVRRIGGERELAVDVRVVAATHRPLEAMIAGGAFRADLYYRLAVVAVEIPPLRRRPEDLPALTRDLLEAIAARHGLPRRPVDDDLIRTLSGHDWPGNVRELSAALERLVLLGRLDLPSLRAPGPVETFDAACCRAIEAALAAAGGRIYGPGGAAELLDLKPTTLQSKIRRLGR